jgi:hypothetical protein
LEWASATASSPQRAQDLALDLLVRELQNLSDREFVFIEGYPRNLEELNTFQETVRSSAEHWTSSLNAESLNMWRDLNSRYQSFCENWYVYWARVQFAGVRFVAIELRCSENVCVQRIGQRYHIEVRVDDKPTAARNRIRYYLQHTRPIVEHFLEELPDTVAIVCFLPLFVCFVSRFPRATRAATGGFHRRVEHCELLPEPRSVGY